MVKFITLTLMALLTTNLVQATQATQQSWLFKVYLNEREIGYHRFTVIENAEQTRVDINAEFQVKFLFINAYRYRHQNTEVWQGDCLQSIEAQTLDNGQRQYVRGNMQRSSLKLNTHNGRDEVQGCIRTFAYWDKNLIRSSHLLNAQTGELLQVNVEHLGVDTLMIGQQPVRANHYLLQTETFRIELWYATDSNEWLALKSITEDGAVLYYQRIDGAHS